MRIQRRSEAVPNEKSDISDIGGVSIPSQRDLTTRHRLSNGWRVVDEYVEPVASATDERRPVLHSTGARLRLLHLCKPCAEGANGLPGQHDTDDVPG